MRDRDLEHPVVTHLLETGEPDGMARKTVTCPVCGEECERFYKDNRDSIFACENCVVIEQAEYIYD